MINKFSVLKYFSSGIFQNYLGFITAKKYIKYFSGTTQIGSWKSNGMSEENIENITKLHSNFAPTVVHLHLLPDINCNRLCLIKNNISVSKKLINLYVSYKLNLQLWNLKHRCLFGSVKLTKNADLDEYKCGDYGVGFNSCTEFLFTDGSF